MKPEDWRYEDFHWKNGMLYLKKEYIGVSLIPHPEYPDMYYIMTDLGESDDFYNKTHAKDNGIKLAMEDIQKGTVHKGIRRATDAFK